MRLRWGAEAVRAARTRLEGASARTRCAARLLPLSEASLGPPHCWDAGYPCAGRGLCSNPGSFYATRTSDRRSITRSSDRHVTGADTHEPSAPGARPQQHNRNSTTANRRTATKKPPLSAANRSPCRAWPTSPQRSEGTEKKKLQTGTFSAWLDVDPGTTARRAREEAT